MADRRMIGLDVGSAGVRAAEVTVHDGTPSLHRFGAVDLPPGAMRAGVVVDPGVITLAIERLWKTRKFSGREVTLGVASGQVVVRAIDLPWVEAEYLQKSLPYLVADVLPVPVEDVLLDFLPFETTPAKGAPIRGLLVAAPRDHVAALVRCVAKAGLRPTRVDLASFALLRATGLGVVPASEGEPANAARRTRFATEALVDIGDSVTNIVVHQGGVPKVVRIVPRGGTDVTAALAERLGVPAAEAELIKRLEGMGATGSKVDTVVRSAVTPLIQQLRGSVDYFTSSHSRVRVDRVLLCGGGAQLPGLPEAVADDLGIETQLIDPLADFMTDGKHLDQGELQLFRPYSAVPVGLALGAA